MVETVFQVRITGFLEKEIAESLVEQLRAGGVPESLKIEIVEIEKETGELVEW